MAVCYRTTPPPWLLLAISQPKWVTVGRVLMMDEVLWFYVLGDFRDMAGMGMNTVRIPVPCWEFHDDIVVNGDFLCTVSRLLDRAKGAGLKAILVLVGGTGENILGLGLSMEECREPPPPNNDNNSNKRDSAALRCAFARQFVGLAPAGRPGPVSRQQCVVVNVNVNVNGCKEREAGQRAHAIIVVRLLRDVNPCQVPPQGIGCGGQRSGQRWRQR
jgi:hypothetical protein